MIWNSTNYFNKEFITETGITEKKYADQTTYVVYAVILGVTHTLGESDTQDDAQDFIDNDVLKETRQQKKDRQDQEVKDVPKAYTQEKK